MALLALMLMHPGRLRQNLVDSVRAGFDVSTANIFASIIFGSIGFGVFMYGKKQAAGKAMAIGIALMAYPYFITNTVAVYLVGIALTAGVFFFKD